MTKGEVQAALDLYGLAWEIRDLGWYGRRAVLRAQNMHAIVRERSRLSQTSPSAPMTVRWSLYVGGRNVFANPQDTFEVALHVAAERLLERLDIRATDAARRLGG